MLRYYLRVIKFASDRPVDSCITIFNFNLYLRSVACQNDLQLVCRDGFDSHSQGFFCMKVAQVVNTSPTPRSQKPTSCDYRSPTKQDHIQPPSDSFSESPPCISQTHEDPTYKTGHIATCTSPPSFDHTLAAGASKNIRPDEPRGDRLPCAATRANDSHETVIPTDPRVHAAIPRATPADVYSMLSHLAKLTDMCLPVNVGSDYAREEIDGATASGAPEHYGFPDATLGELRDIDLGTPDGGAEMGSINWGGQQGWLEEDMVWDGVTDFEMMPVENSTASHGNV
jgi:hypothetical protein